MNKSLCFSACFSKISKYPWPICRYCSVAEILTYLRRQHISVSWFGDGKDRASTGNVKGKQGVVSDETLPSVKFVVQKYTLFFCHYYSGVVLQQQLDWYSILYE